MVWLWHFLGIAMAYGQCVMSCPLIHSWWQVVRFVPCDDKMTLENFMGTNILNLSYIECWLLAAGQANPSSRNDGYTFDVAGSGHVDLGNAPLSTLGKLWGCGEWQGSQVNEECRRLDSLVTDLCRQSSFKQFWKYQESIIHYLF